MYHFYFRSLRELENEFFTRTYVGNKYAEFIVDKELSIKGVIFRFEKKSIVEKGDKIDKEEKIHLKTNNKLVSYDKEKSVFMLNSLISKPELNSEFIKMSINIKLTKNTLYLLIIFCSFMVTQVNNINDLKKWFNKKELK